MTATTTHRPAHSAGPPQPARPARPQPPERDLRATRRTMLALLAAALGVIPLKGLFSDNLWLLDVWATMLIVIAPAALIRLRRPAGALDVWPGIVLLVPWLTARFVHAHAYLGFIPSGATWHDVSRLMTQLHDTSRQEVAPIHTTVAVRLVVCALLGLLAALVDLIAVVGRRGALAGVPLLVVYTVAGAVPRQSVEWPWFAFAAAGYLVLLALDAGDDLDSWGRRVRAPNGVRTRGVLGVSTQRIAAAAIALAIVVPFIVPDQSRNLIADAFHGNSGNGIGGFGDNGKSGGITPFAALKGQLDRPDPISLATVRLIGDSAKQHPFNLRVNVLSHYSDAGWSVESHGNGEPLDATDFDTEPETTVNSESIQAEVTITGLTGNAPVFTVPNRIAGLNSDTSWSAQDQMLLGAKVDRGTKYSEQFNEVRPSTSDLNAAPAAENMQRYLQGGSSVPSFVQDLVARLIKGRSTPYAKARALSDYFADPANNFAYTLKTAPGDSGSALVDFLQNKEGYCQQYAAAMGVMLRVAGVPSRVVLGYMHEEPASDGTFTVSTADAHAWVEAYFGGLGWIPFDTTPVTGLSSGAASDLRWAPHEAFATNAPSGSTTAPAAPTATKKQTTTANTAPTGTATSRDSGSPGLTALFLALGALALLVIVLVPALVRLSRRRRRYAAIRHSADAEALWAELSDTATDYGYVWSPARSPRQVAAWLGADAAASSDSLREIARAVERRRYSPGSAGWSNGTDGNALVGDLRSVSEALREHHRGRARLRATFLPASLGWGLRGGRRRR